MVVDILIVWAVIWGTIAAVFALEADEDGLYWFLMVLFLGFIGILIYMISGDTNSSQQTTTIENSQDCPECGAKNIGEANYCQNCGDELPHISEFDTEATSPGRPPSNETTTTDTQSSNNGTLGTAIVLFTLLLVVVIGTMVLFG